MTDERQKPISLGVSEPILTGDKKRRVIVERIDYPWEMNGQKGTSKQLVISVAKLDSSGDVAMKRNEKGDVVGTTKRTAGIPLELADKVAAALQNLKKK